MLTGQAYATQAMSDQYTGIPYNRLDCQAFVEQVLKDCGVRNTDGSPLIGREATRCGETPLHGKAQ